MGSLCLTRHSSVYAQQNEAREDNKDIVAAAKQDAQNNESKFKWMLGGCCLIGTGMAYVAKPTPPKTDLSDKSAEYIEIYEQAFSQQLFTMARSMGIDNQEQLVILSDGARWINKLAQTQDPKATLILDWWHLKRPVWPTVRGLPADELSDQERPAWGQQWINQLWRGIWR